MMRVCDMRLVCVINVISLLCLLEDLRQAVLTRNIDKYGRC